MLAGEGKLDEAIAGFRKVIDLVPTYSLAHDGLADALVRQGKLDEAIASFRKAIGVLPTDILAHHGLAGVLVRQGKPDEAIASYRKALQLNPNYALARAELARAERLAAVQDKIPAFLKGDYQPKTNEERLALAEWCGIKKRYRTSVSLYTDAFKANPKLADDLRTGSRYNAACAAALASDLGEAASTLDDKERARLRKQALDWLGADLALWTKQLRAFQVAGGRYELLQRVTHWQQDSELASLRDEAALAKLPPQERAACVKVWADVAALLNRARLDDLVRARQDIEINPKDAEAHIYLGAVLAGRGQWDEAFASLRKAIALDPKNARAHLNLGAALASKGQVDDGIASLRKAIEIDPKDATAHLVLGQTLLRIRRYGEARAASARGLELLPEQDPRRPSASNMVQYCDRFIKLEGRLPRLLKGEDKPANIVERLDFAQVAYDHKHFAAAAGLWAEALQGDPRLAANRQTQHRYNAACAAALAAAGQGKVEVPLDDVARAKLRRQALDWLKGEHTTWGGLLASDTLQNRQLIADTLRHWQKDIDLAGIRDAAALAKLPAEERLAWEKLWADVAALLKKAETAPKGRVEAAKQLEQARAHARLREWQKAAQAYAAIIDGWVPDSWGHVAFEYAAVLQLAGDQPGYRAICERLVKRCGQRDVRPYHVARACCLAPGSFTPAERPGELVRAELRGNTAYWSLWLQGALHSRAGRYRDALTLLRNSRDDRFNPPDGVAAVRLWLALTHHRLNESEEARRELEQAEKWLEKFPAAPSPVAEQQQRGHLHNWLEVQVLQREVAPLLRPGSAKGN